MKKYLLSLSCVCVALCVAAGNPSAVASNDEPDQNVTTSAETESTGDSQDETILMKIINPRNVRDLIGLQDETTGGKKKTPIDRPRSFFPGGNGEGLVSNTVGGGISSGNNNGSGQLQSPLSGNTGSSWSEVYSWVKNHPTFNGGGRWSTPIPKPGKPGGTGGTGGTTTQGTNGFPGFDTLVSKPGPAGSVNSIESVTSMIDQLLTEGASEDLKIEDVTNMIDNLLLSK